ncbi:hypothetical protein HY522_06955, partial [bacterium]|nr:hypothetical protein [bacterium]
DSVGVDSYAVEAAKNTGFTNMVFTDTIDGVLTSDTLTGLYNDTYYWRVRAIDDLGNQGAYSSTRGFVTDTIVNQATLASPADGHETTAVNFLVMWTAVSDSVDVDSYALEVSRNPAFTAMVFTDTLDGALTSDTVTGLYNDTYYWRVRAIDDLGNQGAYSPARGFVTDTLVNQASLASPADGHETTAINFQVRWNAVSDSVGVDSYALEVSKISSFTTMVFTDTVDGALTGDAVTGLYNDTYYWRVRTIDDLGNQGAYSAVRGFITDTIVNQVTLSSPANGHETTAVDFLVGWTAVSDSVGVDSYAVEAAKNTGFTNMVFTDTIDGVLTTDTLTGLYNDTYYWRVRAIDDLGNQGAYSAARGFVTDTDVDTVVLASPADGATEKTRTPTLTWNAVPDSVGIDSYSIELYIWPSYTTLVFSDTIDGSLTSVTATQQDSGSYFWRVRAMDIRGNQGVFEDTFKLNLDTDVVSRPGDWSGFSPVSDTTDTTPNASIQTRDTVAGLDISTGGYQYSVTGAAGRPPTGAWLPLYEDFQDGDNDGWTESSGNWVVAGDSTLGAPGGVNPAITFAGDTITADTYMVDMWIQLLNTINAENGFMMISYVGQTNFYYAGMDEDADSIVIGYYDGAWHHANGVSETLLGNEEYFIRTIVEGNVATFYAKRAYGSDTENWVRKLSYDFAGCCGGLPDGQVGIVAQNSQARFDTVNVWLGGLTGGADGTTDFQTLTAQSVTFNQESDTANLVRFSLMNPKGYEGRSPDSYGVSIPAGSAPYDTVFSPADGGIYSADLTCSFVLFDADSDYCTAIVEYSINAGATWLVPTTSGSLSNLTSGPDGLTKTFTWLTKTDLPDTDISTVRMRITVYDFSDTGPADTTLNFRIDNAAPPILTVVRAVANLTGAETGVYLTWNTSSASDSAGYHIFRSSTLDSRLSTRINSALISDTTGYLDTTAVRGDTQFYYVVAADLRSNFSDSSVLWSAPNLTVQKTGLIGNLRPGDTIAYSITVVNDGFAPARTIVLYDFRPANSIFFDSAAAPSGWEIDYRVDSVANVWQSVFSDTSDMVRFTAAKTLDPTVASASDTLTLKVKIQ